MVNGRDFFEDEDYDIEPMLSADADGEGDFDEFLDEIDDIDFSEFKGDFKSSVRKMSRKMDQKKAKRIKKKPLTKQFSVKRKADIVGGKRQIGKVIVPRDRTVIVEGVDDFILSDQHDAVKNIGYYKGKKLKELVLIFNNNSALDFNLELFNPSMPLDYLQSTSLNLNDKVQVSGGGYVSYTDVLFNLLANPALLVNAKFTFSGPAVADQINQPLIFKNKRILGDQHAKPIQLQLQLDTMQVQSDIVFFDMLSTLGRPFVPDGMDVIQYNVLAGNTVTFAFYYDQKMIKKMFYKEMRSKKTR